MWCGLDEWVSDSQLKTSLVVGRDVGRFRLGGSAFVDVLFVGDLTWNNVAVCKSCCFALPD